jgi:hypothetical protein
MRTGVLNALRKGEREIAIEKGTPCSFTGQAALAFKPMRYQSFLLIARPLLE